MSYLVILFYVLMTLIPHSTFHVYGAPIGRSNVAWLKYLNKAMNRPTELFTVANNPGQFDSLSEANSLLTTHPNGNLVISRGRWALAVGDSVFAFSSDNFNQTISEAVIADAKLEPSSNTSPLARRDHPFSWGGHWDQPQCTPGFPCEDADDCKPYNCDECWEDMNTHKWECGEP